MMPKAEGIDVTQQDSVTVIDVGTRYVNIDELMVRELRNPLLNASSAADPPLVLIDLSHTRYFGSTFLEVLLRAGKAVSSQEGGRLVFCGLSEYCLEIFEVTKLNRLWQFYKTRDEAIAALNSAPE